MLGLIVLTAEVSKGCNEALTRGQNRFSLDVLAKALNTDNLAIDLRHKYDIRNGGCDERSLLVPLRLRTG